MAAPAKETLAQNFQGQGVGPVTQIDLSTYDKLKADGSLPTQGTIAAAGNYLSQAIPANGMKAIGVGCKSTQTGAINIQRYLDLAGQVPVGAVITAALVAGTSNWATVNDGVPFQSFTFQITNTGGGAATITNFAVLLNAA